MSAETIPMRLHGNQYGNSEVTYTYNRGNRGDYILFALRVYFDGIYQEPPASVLPPVPQIMQNTNQECCTLL